VFVDPNVWQAGNDQREPGSAVIEWLKRQASQRDNVAEALALAQTLFWGSHARPYHPLRLGPGSSRTDGTRRWIRQLSPQ
jgi:hypothetical protein